MRSRQGFDSGLNLEKGFAYMTNTAQKTSDNPILRWVTFRLENEKYGINVMQVQEVLRVTEIAPVPGAPDHVLGI
ncbi:MAG: hypothetical protein AMJ53_12055, partial [Gammaproteobacteria bacterium SG8_11]